jgi:hypothetical protein
VTVRPPTFDRSTDVAAIQRQVRDTSAGHPAGMQRSVVDSVLRSAGRPLQEPLRTEMEDRLRATFADVRVHDDAAAQRSASQLGARAYTSGNHVVLGSRGIDRETLAHELTHVVQQRSGPVAGTDTGNGIRMSDPSDRFEREAEATAARLMAYPAANVLRGPSQPVAEPVQRAAGHGFLPEARALSGATNVSVIQRTIRLGASPDALRPLAFEAAVGLLLKEKKGASVGLSVVNDMIKSDRVFADEGEFIEAAIEAALDTPVAKEDLTLGELANLTAVHTKAVGEAATDFNNPTGTMLRGIPTGSSFSSKFDENGVLGGNLTPEQVGDLRSRVIRFRDFAEHLSRGLDSSLRGKQLQVYRSTFVPPEQLQVGSAIRHPLPFSTTYSHDFATKDWGDKPVLLEITAPMSLHMVSISQLGSEVGEEQIGYKPINQGQMEVTLAPCSLKITEVKMPSAGRYLVYAVAVPLTPEEVSQDLEAAEKAAGEAQARRKIPLTVDAEDLGKHFDEENVAKIKDFEEGEILEVTDKDGKKWDVFSYDDFFGAEFTRERDA